MNLLRADLDAGRRVRWTPQRLEAIVAHACREPIPALLRRFADVAGEHAETNQKFAQMFVAGEGDPAGIRQHAHQAETLRKAAGAASRVADAKPDVA